MTARSSRKSPQPPMVAPLDREPGPVHRRPTLVCATLVPLMTTGLSAGQLRGRPLPSCGRVLLGRAETVHLRIDHMSVSKRHARIEAERGGFWIIDLGSTNGSFVNGARVEGAVALEDGDVVRLGSVVFNFSAIEAPVRETRVRRPQVEDPHEAVTIHASREELLRRAGIAVLPGPHSIAASKGRSRVA